MTESRAEHTPKSAFDGVEPAYSYTLQQSVDDGFHVDLTEWAAEVGYTGPVHVTRRVWDELIEWEKQDTERQVYQDTRGRGHDVLHMAGLAARNNRGDWFCEFELFVVPRGGRGRKARKVKLWQEANADGVTILFPEEH